MTLLDYGFSLYQPAHAGPRGRALRAPRSATTTSALPLVATRTVRLTVRRGQRLETAVDAPARASTARSRAASASGRAGVSVDGDVAGRAPLAATRAARGARRLLAAGGRRRSRAACRVGRWRMRGRRDHDRHCLALCATGRRR